MPIFHQKTNNIPDPTQADLDAQIALGNYPEGTTLADIALASDWNEQHTNPDIADVTGLQDALDDKATKGTSVAFTSVNVNGNNGNGHIHLRHQANDAPSTGNSSTIFADSDGNLAWRNDGLNKVTLGLNGITAARRYAFQDSDGTVAHLSDVAGKQDVLVINQTTVDFGAFSYMATASIVDATVTSATRVMVSVAGTGGRDADELEFSPLSLAAIVTDGVGYDIIATAPLGADGQFNINHFKG